ncbi:MAG: hypothetical protein JRJ29_19860 [Deltaproteobacteria bacterium]|nr:hypothetical protein [Deltaproteobacteria bacterium]
MFRKEIMESSPPYELDTERLCKETVSLCSTLLEESPHVGAILLECTNLAPYRDTLAKKFSLPVFDVTHLANLIYAGVSTV